MFILLPALGQPYLSHPILSCFLLCPVPSPSSPASCVSFYPLVIWESGWGWGLSGSSKPQGLGRTWLNDFCPCCPSGPRLSLFIEHLLCARACELW